MSNSRLNNDEVVTGASFLKTNFLEDRGEIEAVFPEFDKFYQEDYINQIEIVKKLDSKFAKTKQQVKATETLYDFSNKVNTEMNVVSFKFKSAGVDTTLISAIKKNLKNLDIEGAVDKIGTLSTVIADNISALQPKGITPEYPETLIETGEKLLDLNTQQNKLMDDGEKMTDANQKEYDKLRKMVSKIIAAGKIVFKEEKRADFYNLRKLIQRMRAPKRDKNPGEE
ncbi:hypothetical protein J2X31_000928 [Flavobacterium arsenatis]|uniref:Uncharacterized protein n=1 Tax=Flavobacterium arsenatis TaxID=1484332 RepID=A0ABU1TLT9_9FLAO|nr:hypothetical protein [Flavobacterium arsenatis]MDR6966928.1 hypothetical protein [Flavobacterium arsenatis]